MWEHRMTLKVPFKLVGLVSKYEGTGSDHNVNKQDLPPISAVATSILNFKQDLFPDNCWNSLHSILVIEERNHIERITVFTKVQAVVLK